MESGGEIAHWIASAGSAKFFIAASCGSLASLACGYGAWLFLLRKRIMQDMPTALIRSAPQGYIELQGYAEMMDGEPIYAGLSQRPCVWYRYKIEQRESGVHSHSRSNKWRTTETKTSDDLFNFVDSTGRCAVDPEGAKVTTAHKDVWYGNTKIPPKHDPDRSLLRFVGISQLGRSYRYTEERIEPDDNLYALGNFTTHGGAGTAFDFKGEVGNLLRAWKQDHNTMLNRFDTNRDGEIDVQEWEAARRTAEHEIVAQRESVAAAPPVDVLGSSKTARNPFILTNKTETEMLNRHHWSALGLLTLCTLLFTVTTWAITVRFS